MTIYRSKFRDSILDRNGNVVSGATINVYEPGTTTPIAQTIYDAPSGGSPLSNPLSSDASGNVEFWLQHGQAVDLAISYPGMTGVTIRSALVLTDPATNWVVNVLLFGVTGDGSDEREAIQDLIDGLPATGGVLEFPPPPVAYCIGDTLHIGDGDDDTESTKHGVKLYGIGSGVGNEISGIATNCGSLIQAHSSFATSTTTPMIQLNGVIHDVEIRGLQLDANSKAGIGVKTIHAYKFHYENVNVRRWRGIAYDFNTRGGEASWAVGCGEGTVMRCHAHEPALSTAHAVKLDGNDDTNLDCARIHFKAGEYWFGSDAGARGFWLRFADNCYFDGVMPISAGSGDQVYFEQATNTAFPAGNKFFNPTMTKIGGTAGTGGTLFVGWLSDVEPPVMPNVSFITEQGYLAGLRDIASYGAITASSTLSNSTTTTNQKTYTLGAGRGNDAGAKIVLRSAGTLKAVGGDGCAFTFRHRFATQTASSIAISGLAAGDYGWILETILRVRTTGATATVASAGARLFVEGQAPIMDGSRRPGSTLTVDMTAAVAIDARNSMSVANANNQITTEDHDADVILKHTTN